MNDATLLGLKPRAIQIFNALVAAYLESGQPIGSKTLAQRLRLDLSPASIRSNMSDLEQAGLLFAPHTSAGRIPTESGLRMFVDGLMEYNPDLRQSCPVAGKQCRAAAFRVCAAWREPGPRRTRADGRAGREPPH